VDLPNNQLRNCKNRFVERGQELGYSFVRILLRWILLFWPFHFKTFIPDLSNFVWWFVIWCCHFCTVLPSKNLVYINYIFLRCSYFSWIMKHTIIFLILLVIFSENVNILIVIFNTISWMWNWNWYQYKNVNFSPKNCIEKWSDQPEVIFNNVLGIGEDVILVDDAPQDLPRVHVNLLKYEINLLHFFRARTHSPSTSL